MDFIIQDAKFSQFVPAQLLSKLVSLGSRGGSVNSFLPVCLVHLSRSHFIPDENVEKCWTSSTMIKLDVTNLSPTCSDVGGQKQQMDPLYLASISFGVTLFLCNWLWTIVSWSAGIWVSLQLQVMFSVTWSFRLIHAMMWSWKWSDFAPWHV